MVASINSDSRIVLLSQSLFVFVYNNEIIDTDQCIQGVSLSLSVRGSRKRYPGSSGVESCIHSKRFAIIHMDMRRAYGRTSSSHAWRIADASDARRVPLRLRLIQVKSLFTADLDHSTSVPDYPSITKPFTFPDLQRRSLLQTHKEGRRLRIHRHSTFTNVPEQDILIKDFPARASLSFSPITSTLQLPLQLNILHLQRKKISKECRVSRSTRCST